MDKIWLEHYPDGVPADIDPHQYPSLIALLEQSFKKYKNKPAFQNAGSCMTYQQLDNHTRNFAAFLQKKLQVNRGSRVAIMMPNLLQYPVTMLGVLRAGMVVTNINPLYTRSELTHQLNDSGSEVLVVLENFIPVVIEALPALTTVKYIIVTKVGDLFHPIKRMLVNFVVQHIKQMIAPWKLEQFIWFRQALQQGRQETFTDPELTHDDIAFLQYTGGTTGVVKGAVLTQRNMLANVMQAHACIRPFMREGQEIIITALPLYHIFSLTANCLVFMRLGGLNVLITNPRDMPNFVKQIKKVKFTAMTGVNTLFNALLNITEFREMDFSQLSLTLGGGMAIQSTVAERWQAVTGCVLLEAYGLTEASPAVCINPFNITGYNGTVGLPVPSTEVSIRDNSGQELAFNQVGELYVRGPQIMREYWYQPEETKKVLSADGWLMTGDIASINEQGYIRICERSKDMIIVSGFNVYPNEVEAVIAELTDVLEVAVIGVPHDVSGEMVKAVVVRKGQSLTSKKVQAYCHSQLTHYKVPKIVEFRDDLPKSTVGKVLRRALREEQT